METGNSTAVKQASLPNVGSDACHQGNNTGEVQPSGHWGENRLADVVRGTVKVKNNCKDVNTVEGDSPRAVSPQQNPVKQLVILEQTETSVQVGVGDSQPECTTTPPVSPKK